MADERLPLLRGSISGVDTYAPPQRGGKSPKLPSVDPKSHRVRLLDQLDALDPTTPSRELLVAPG